VGGVARARAPRLLVAVARLVSRATLHVDELRGGFRRRGVYEKRRLDRRAAARTGTAIRVEPPIPLLPAGGADPKERPGETASAESGLLARAAISASRSRRARCTSPVRRDRAPRRAALRPGGIGGRPATKIRGGPAWRIAPRAVALAEGKGHVRTSTRSTTSGHGERLTCAFGEGLGGFARRSGPRAERSPSGADRTRAICAGEQARAGAWLLIADFRGIVHPRRGNAGARVEANALARRRRGRSRHASGVAFAFQGAGRPPRRRRGRDRPEAGGRAAGKPGRSPLDAWRGLDLAAGAWAAGRLASNRAPPRRFSERGRSRRPRWSSAPQPVSRGGGDAAAVGNAAEPEASGSSTHPPKNRAPRPTPPTRGEWVTTRGCG